MPFPFLPVAEQVIGGVLSTIEGNDQQREADKLAKQAQAVKPPLVDPNEQSFLNDLMRKRRAIATGTAYQQQFADIGTNQRATQQGIVRASGGAGGAAIAGINRAGQVANNAMQDVIQQGQQQEMQYTGMANALNSRIAQRREALQHEDYSRLLGQSEQSRLAGKYNKNAGISSIIGGVTTGGQYALDNIILKRKQRNLDNEVSNAVAFSPTMPDPNEQYPE